jgi:hypothetical protein
MNQTHLITDGILAGFPPLTSSNLACVPFDDPYSGLHKGQWVRLSLKASYKGTQPALFLNVYSQICAKATRAEELLFKGRKQGQPIYSMCLRPSLTYGETEITWTNSASCLLHNWFVWLISEWKVTNLPIQTTSSTILSWKIKSGISWSGVLGYAQPIRNNDWIVSLSPSDYRSAAQRWGGLASTAIPGTLEGCRRVIMDHPNKAPVHHPWHDDAAIAFEKPISDSTKVVHNNTGYGLPGVALLPLVGPAAAAPASSYVAQPKASIPPMPASASSITVPTGTSSITEQIEALTARADEATTLARRVDELIEEVKVLRARPQMTIHSGPNFTASGKVDIAGQEMDHYKLTPCHPWTVPAIEPQYNLPGWQANFEAGDLKVSYTIANVMKTILTGAPTRLIGPPATGKTSGIQQACAHMGIPCRVIQCGKGLTEYTLLGEQTIDGGDVVFQDGILPRLFKSATPEVPHVVVIDEGDHLKKEIQSVLHGVLEGGFLDLPSGETVIVPDNVIFVMTANTYGTGDITGRHSSANVSDDAFISRWTRSFTVDYLKPDEERALLLAYGCPTEGKGNIDDLMKFVAGTRDQARQIDRGTLNDGIRTPVTLRSLIPYCQDCAAGVPAIPSFCSSVMGQFSPDELQHVRELVRACLDF